AQTSWMKAQRVPRPAPPAPANSGARGIIEKGVQGANSSVLEDRNVHARDHRRGPGRSELPPQTAKIVIDLRGRYRAKSESGSILENSPDLCVERFSASHRLLRLEKHAVRGV